MKILIISGGTSSEREISLLSAKAVREALEINEHQVQVFDFKQGYTELKKAVPEFDVIFPVLHGEEGEGGGLQKFLHDSGKPYVGGDPAGFQEGWFKLPFKKYCDKNNIPTASWKEVKIADDIIRFGFPSVLKASNGGSSKEVVILKSAEDLKKDEAAQLLTSGTEVFVEKFLPGVETTVGILNGRALPVIEIKPPEGKWFDYQNKYSGKTQEIPHAPSLDDVTRQKAQQTALKIHQSLKLGPYSRIDFIITSSNSHSSSGKPTSFALEVNTIPGLTSQSLFPKAAQATGISFEDLVQILVELGFSQSLK